MTMKNPIPLDPIPLIRDFSHTAKQQKNRPLSLNPQDYQTIKSILDNQSHPAFNAQSIANLLLALAYRRTRWAALLNKELDRPLLHAIAQNADRFNPQGIANTLWALATMGINWRYVQENGSHLSLVHVIARNYNQFALKGAIQIMWTVLWFDIQLPENVLQHLKTVIASSKQPQSSRLHQRFAKLLARKVTLPFHNEYPILGFIPVDICFPDKKLVIEIDGPSHTIPRDKFKNELLKKFGYAVERVSYQDDFDAKVSCIVNTYFLQATSQNQSAPTFFYSAYYEEKPQPSYAAILPNNPRTEPKSESPPHLLFSLISIHTVLLKQHQLAIRHPIKTLMRKNTNGTVAVEKGTPSLIIF
ncbi:DUF1601 domain-containing protein [Coxiella burnetii]|uniref:DUF1601 domain-containing protein n=1 Tax=Coxiella burnetii TaxID=777 RepID=UPI000183D13F|nr:DUF1601 domain-containing protein [Coxiella burnetii]ACJ20150.1 hypothetical membrane-associated protein [Coxiella burnetii CbuK_Q154]PHH56649.1 hypothetical protein CRH12_09790 [Coxiella burnetii]